MTTIEIKRTDVFGPEMITSGPDGMKAASRYYVTLAGGVRVPVLITLANQIALRQQAVTNATLWKEILMGYFERKLATGWQPSTEELTLQDAEVLEYWRERKHRAEEAAGK